MYELFNISISYNNAKNEFINENYQIETFIQIIPTGISVIGLENGVTEASYGYDQDVELNQGQIWSIQTP